MNASWKTKSVKRCGTIAAAIALIGGIVPLAHADASSYGCDDGSRRQAAQFADAGQASTLDTSDIAASAGGTFGGMAVALRASASGCVWALYTSPPLRAELTRFHTMGNYVWIDKSVDGGLTWEKERSHEWSDVANPHDMAVGVKGKTSSHSGVVDASWEHLAVRACGRSVHFVTTLHEASYERENSPTVCTRWFS